MSSFGPGFSSWSLPLGLGMGMGGCDETWTPALWGAERGRAGLWLADITSLCTARYVSPRLADSVLYCMGRGLIQEYSSVKGSGFRGRVRA
jgi:hypothetical protein